MPMSNRRPRRARRCLAVLGAGAGVGILAVTAGGLPPASGALQDVPETGQDGYLVLRADPYPAYFTGLTPGDRVAWTIETRLENEPAGNLSLRLMGSGDLVDHTHGIRISVRSCTEPFATTKPEALCPGEEARLVEATRLADVGDPVGRGPDGGAQGIGADASDHGAASGTWTLADLESGSPRYVMVTMGLPSEASWDDSLQGLTGDVGVGLYASGAAAGPDSGPDAAPDPAPGTDPDADSDTDGILGTQTPMPRTGTVGILFLAVAAGLVLVGVALAAWARRRSGGRA
ncbi:hypothetical protein AB0333_01455 [Citricoccus sp. NPDC079358]|uniref:hypothetical protein n=1 Tax=Citricoccus sp. NPDC079358 TaxID=3154653 RepID=UPI0034503068